MTSGEIENGARRFEELWVLRDNEFEQEATEKTEINYQETSVFSVSVCSRLRGWQRSRKGSKRESREEDLGVGVRWNEEFRITDHAASK
jgi:hypothetical protein